MAAGLRIITARTSLAASAAADRALGELAARGERCALIAADAQAAELAKRRIAGRGVALLGCGVTTLGMWALDRWALFGDGRVPATSGQRRALVMRAVEQAAREAAASEGGARLNLHGLSIAGCVESLEREAAGLPGFERPDAAALAELNDAQRDLLAICRVYERLLAERGLIEPGAACGLLGAAMGSLGWEHLVLDGASELTASQRALLVEAARHAGVTACVRANATGDAPGEAGAPFSPALVKADDFLRDLVRRCERAGVTVSGERAAEDASPWRALELDDLALTLFRAGEGHVVQPTGALRFVLPAGRYAQGEAVAREVARLRDEQGIAPRDVILTCADPLATAEQLAARLATRGIACLAQGPRPLALTHAARALLGLMQLAEAAGEPFGCEAAPEPQGKRGSEAAPNLAGAPEPHAAPASAPGSYDARPPAPRMRPLASDLARNPMLGVRQSDALRLDRAWRQRRLTSARDMLHDLADASAPARGALSALRKGDALGALAALDEPAGSAFDSDARLEQAALDALAQRLREALEAWGSPDAPALSLGSEVLARLIEGVTVRTSRLTVPPEALAAQRDAAVLAANPNAVRVMTLREAQGRHARAVVACDLSADLTRAGDQASAAARLLEALGVYASTRPVDELRWRFSAVVEAAGETLVLERLLADEKARELRPSTLFEEVVDCYRPDVTSLEDLDKKTGLPKDGALPRAPELGEEAFAELASPAGPLDRARTPQSAPQLALTGAATRERLVRADGLISPSSLEGYLRCPARWFFERRLPTLGIDAQFGPLQRGTFNHEVLCAFHRRMPGELGLVRITTQALAERGAEVDALLDRCFDETVALHRARVLAAGGQGGPHASAALDQLVATTTLEQRSLEALRPALRGCVRRDAQLPDGYAPAHHEWRFGDVRAGQQPTPYAGVLLFGVIDRVDVSADGHALVIDYKGALGAGYELPAERRDQPVALPAPDEPEPALDDAIPLHSQALMYARAMLMSGTPVDGVIYLSYVRPAAKAFVSPNAIDDLPQRGLLDRSAWVGLPGERDGLADLIDLVELRCARAVERMRDGDIEAAPRFGKLSCDRCPLAATCGKRVF